MIADNLILDSLTTAVLAFSTSGTCAYSNEASQVLLSRSDSWLLGRDLNVIFGATQKVAERCRAALSDQQHVILREVEIPLPDWQRTLLVDLNMTPILTNNEPALILEMIDRKDVRKLAQDTSKTARFKAATQIVRGLCHEIKNPLGGIRGAAQLLEMEHRGTQIQEYTNVIMQEVDRLSELLNRMSGGVKTTSREITDIHVPLAEVANLLKAEYGDAFELRYDFDTSLPRVNVNIDQLKQALLNLLKNAVQWSMLHVDKKRPSMLPVICLKTRAAQPDPMRSLMPGPGVQLQIQDAGPGVDPKLLDQLFLPMVTTREGGTGLGLVISQEIVQSHGGFIELDEDEHQGASFSLYLPYRNAAQHP